MIGYIEVEKLFKTKLKEQFNPKDISKNQSHFLEFNWAHFGEKVKLELIIIDYNININLI